MDSARRARACAASVFGIIAVLVATEGVSAATVPVNCNSNPTTALQTALSEYGAGTVFAITGICQQNVQTYVNVPVIWITNETQSTTASLISTDGIEGQLSIVGPVIVYINGITLEGTSSDTGLVDNIDVSASATAIIQNSQIVRGQRTGLNVDAGASVELLNTTVSGNGIANVAGQNDGMRASTGASVQIGEFNADGSINSGETGTISNNSGNGVAALSNSHVSVAGGSIDGNDENQVIAAGGAVLGLFGVEITQTQVPTTPGDFAIQDLGASTMLLAGGTMVSGGSVAGAAMVGSASSLLLVGATLSSSSSMPTLEVTGSSNAILSGGNTLTNTLTGGDVVELDHSASLQQWLYAGQIPEFAAHPVAHTPAPETITGAGLVQEQSSLDIGQGIIASSTGLTWNGSISVQQNSSFRLSGGVHVTGTVSLTQGSNGFLNVANGGTNNVDGTIDCPFTTVAASHVSAPQKATPNVVVATSYAAATTPQCLPF